MATKKVASSQEPVASSDPMGVLPSRLTRAETAKREEQTRTEREGLPDLEMHADELDKSIDQRWSEDESEYMTSTNKMEDCVRRYRQEWGAAAVGMSFKFFTPAIASEIGTEDYEKCLDKKGQPYMVGLDWMGMIPTRIAEARLRKYAKDSQDLVTASEERFGNGVDRLRKEAEKLGMTLTTSGGVQIGGSSQ